VRFISVLSVWVRNIGGVVNEDTKIMKFTKYAGSLAAALLFSATANAATVVNVELSGEGGSAMSLKIDKPTVKAGETVFQVKNTAMTEDHEMVLVRLKKKDQKVPLIASKHRIDESKLRPLSEVADLKPSGTGELKAALKPGDYLLFCNIKGHYEAGMSGHLTVTN